MFKEAFEALQKRFAEVLAEYWELRKTYGIEVVSMANFESLPVEFIKKRAEVFDRYSDFFDERRRVFEGLGQGEKEAEAVEALDVFSTIESNDDFKVFLDFFAYMPRVTHRLIFGELLTEQHRDHLRTLMNNAPVIEKETPDIDVGGELSPCGNHDLFVKLLIVSFSASTKNEKGVTSLPGIRTEKIRKELAVQILKEKGII